MAIPGQIDPALKRFEEDLYHELRCQHDRLDLFVSSKADEISRRLGTPARPSARDCCSYPCHDRPFVLIDTLEHLAQSITRWLTKSHDETTNNTSIRYQRRFAKYERELLRCGGDTQALTRFVGAQGVAFRKIIKKYKVS